MDFLTRHFGDDISTETESCASTTVPNNINIMTSQMLSVASSCSSSTTSSYGISSSSSSSEEEDNSTYFTKESYSIFSASQSGYYGEDEETRNGSISLMENTNNHDEDKAVTRSSSSSSTAARLSLHLDDVRRLARLGRNATVKNKCRLPASISKQDIYVQVDFDERAHSSNSGPMEQIVQDAIRDDLRTVYSADAASAKLFLCLVVVVLSDGSLYRTLTDRDGVIGLAEIGLVWRLFEADNLTVYDGGLVVQTEQVVSSIFDFLSLTNRGRECLLDRLVPRIANDVVSRIADSNEELLVEF